LFHFESFQEALMALKSAFVAAVWTGLLALSGPAMADQYRPDEFLGLDLSKAVLSPKPLGPPTEFAPVPIEAKADRGSDAQARVEPKSVPTGKAVRAAKVIAAPVERPRSAARAKLAKRHSNPLDAEARDTRVQTWPCKSGGICNWQR
jgi:hypothetical protein